MKILTWRIDLKSSMKTEFNVCLFHCTFFKFPLIILITSGRHFVRPISSISNPNSPLLWRFILSRRTTVFRFFTFITAWTSMMNRFSCFTVFAGFCFTARVHNRMRLTCQEFSIVGTVIWRVLKFISNFISTMEYNFSPSMWSAGKIPCLDLLGKIEMPDHQESVEQPIVGTFEGATSNIIELLSEAIFTKFRMLLSRSFPGTTVCSLYWHPLTPVMLSYRYANWLQQWYRPTFESKFGPTNWDGSGW